jgi:hypothetical protein
MSDSVFHKPASLLVSTEREMEGIPSVELFNDSRHKMLRERWCAAMFGVGYSKHVAPCTVAVNESRYRADVDMFLRAADQDWEFQVTEVQTPGRRRGLEFKQFADGNVRLAAYSVDNAQVLSWLAQGAEHKKAKRYSGSHGLNLLLYANFAVSGLEYELVAAALSRFAQDFASIWVVTSLHLCSAFSQPGLGEVRGWGPIRSIEDYCL